MIRVRAEHNSHYMMPEYYTQNSLYRAVCESSLRYCPQNYFDKPHPYDVLSHYYEVVYRSYLPRPHYIHRHICLDIYALYTNFLPIDL